MSTVVRTVVSTRTIVIGNNSRTIVRPVTATRTIRTTGPQGPSGNNGADGSAMIYTDLSADTTMLVGHIYRTIDSAVVNLTLPATAVKGDPIVVQGYGVGGFNVLVGSGKVIHLAGGVDTLTSGMNLYSVNQYDRVELECVVNNTEWIAKTYGCYFS